MTDKEEEGGEGMNRTVGLRPALWVAGIYAIAVGVILHFPSLSVAVFDRPVTDVAVEAGWGSALVALGILVVAMASNVEKYGDLAAWLVLGLMVTTLDLVYFFVTNAYSMRTIIVPIIINAILIAWIWSARPK